ncbi:MAG: hypothetical protein LC753_03380 [Acidobacteria bacterium]|nr:hypothetical protein [Acidobacteriota bacterium]MCA1649340.1 hypothetical protein [Acidobacteriota bacterium]
MRSLLTRHFLQRFLENDLISPDADRHEVLSAASAVLIASGLFVTILLGLKYLTPFQSPGRTAVEVLDDRFFYITCAMIVMALVAVVEWDALGLDARDTSILGPLPINRGDIVRAKLAAVAIFAAGFALALNLAPSMMFSWLVVAKLRAGLLEPLMLAAAQAGICMAAGAFGFLSVLALRELLYAAFGAWWSSGIATGVQAMLVVLLGAVLLLTPSLSSDVAGVWLAPGASSPFAVPPLWFVGLHERLAGGVIIRLPREELPEQILGAETEATALYDSHGVMFQQLGYMAIAALLTAAVIALGAFAWNSRRLPVAPSSRRSRRGRVSEALRWVLQRIVVRTPEAQAGFFFTLQCLSRSLPHRVGMAIFVAIGFAAAAVSLVGTDVRHGEHVALLPLRFFAIQPVLATALLVGFRYVVAVPAELRANWAFHLSWSGDERPYLTGVKRAAFGGLVLPTLWLLFPLHAMALGFSLALVHLLCGLVLSLVLLEGLLLGFRKLPFASSHVPSVNLKTLGPIYLLGAFLALYGLAWLERLALETAVGIAAFLAGGIMLVATLRVIDMWQRRTRVAIELDELPPPATQRLGLSG